MDSPLIRGKTAGIILGLGVAFLAVLVWWPVETPTPLTALPASRKVAVAPATTPLSRPSSPPIAAPALPQIDPRQAGSPLAAELNAPNSDARQDVATLHAMLRQYLRIKGSRQGPPIGNDSDLARVLTGRNPMKLVVLPASHPALTADDRLRDRWGTPYFIHPRGNLSFEIRSAGPDRKLFTTDDLVENPGTGRTNLANLPPDSD